ncbi:helix-turn-helix domain-containing protein [Bacillus sp. FSL K6-3431]|uniref:helix-turn-helix domain-containing protein n=1 Tax=Bacillus sp. FSL K6-3431 TaxID=2921500 RepID=UPI0030FB6F90
MINFDPLFKTLESRNLNPNYLRKNGLVDGKTLAKMAKGGSIRLETVARICTFLDVPIEQVVRITK